MAVPRRDIIPSDDVCIMSSMERACEWCGKPATEKIEIAPGRVGTFNGRRKPVMPRRVDACSPCAKRLQGQA